MVTFSPTISCTFPPAHRKKRAETNLVTQLRMTMRVLRAQKLKEQSRDTFKYGTIQVLEAVKEGDEVQVGHPLRHVKSLHLTLSTVSTVSTDLNCRISEPISIH